MLLNGIGNSHGSDTHHVTSCMHDHSVSEKKGGAAASGVQNTGNPALTSVRQAEAQFSLSAWLQKTLQSGKKLWGGIWGSDALGETDAKNAEAQSSAQTNDSNVMNFTGENLSDKSVQQDFARKLHTPQIAAAATAVTQMQDMRSNPYFSAVDRADDSQGNLWQRIKVKFKNTAGQLAGHLPGKFFSAQTKSSFQAKQDRPKEDLRKHSKFRKDEVEIDCVLTDDSYLLDSYDRKGEYSKLSAKK